VPGTDRILFDCYSQGDLGVYLNQTRFDRRWSGIRGLGAHRHHGLRNDPRLSRIVDADHPVHCASGSGCQRIGAGARVFDSMHQDVALEHGPILDVEPDTLHGCGPSLYDEIENLADTLDTIEPHLEPVMREVVARHAAAVREIELLLDGISGRANRFLLNSRFDKLLLDGGHRVRILFLRVSRGAGSRLDGHADERLIRYATNGRFAGGDDHRQRRIQWRLLLCD